MAYKHLEIEDKWQKAWDESRCYVAEDQSDKPKYYALSMFPYPSGAGLHMGHIASYTPTDIVARYKRSKGFNVLHPMGYDAFGLPAEQYAIKTGVHPDETTQKTIAGFRKLLQDFGFSYDWSREVSTCDPNFYKWTQKIFLKLFEKGLAYQKDAPVNWCPALKTVLANDEIIDGKSERGGHPVVRKPMKQWMLKITDYADRLLEDLESIDWPNKTKEGQKNWIGKSVGAKIQFKIDGYDESFTVFTTRPDTLFGATFMVLAPEHPLVAKITTDVQKEKVNQYISDASKKSELDRKSNLDKTGVFTGAYTLHPFTDEKIPIWISDYVLMDYGTGAIMSVPAHDTRDFDFAKHFEIPIKQVLNSSGEPLPFEGDGTLINSDFLNGLDKQTAIQTMIKKLEELKIGEAQTQYKLRDWLFSRQRYWGEPFPIIHSEDGTNIPVSDDELPVTLPEVADYEPSDAGEPPLARVDDFVNYDGPSGKGKRNTDTMPGSAGSSWYFLRYIDPHNSSQAFSDEAQKYWMPVDLYIGGPEHTVGHLLYARFWQKVLFDAGLVDHKEPFDKLAHQGTIMGPDGRRMSKRWGNVINPGDLKQTHGVDATRVYAMFMGPFEKDKPWDTNGIDGARRFLERVWRLVADDNGDCVAEDVSVSDNLNKMLHKAIKKVGEDIEKLSFNTAISTMMILVNEVYKEGVKPKALLTTLSQLLMPFAPHISEEIWQKLGQDGLVAQSTWPTYNPDLIVDDVVTIGVQVSGKMRGKIEISVDCDESEAVAKAKEIHAVQNALDGKNIFKVIYKAGKILNIIAK